MKSVSYLQVNVYDTIIYSKQKRLKHAYSILNISNNYITDMCYRNNKLAVECMLNLLYWKLKAMWEVQVGL